MAETLASAVLGFAFIVSVAYYLNLFGAFGLSLTPWDSPLNARLLTSAIYAVILIVGFTKGFAALERMEYASVAAKLAIIAGLILGSSGSTPANGHRAACPSRPRSSTAGPRSRWAWNRLHRY